MFSSKGNDDININTIFKNERFGWISVKVEIFLEIQ